MRTGAATACLALAGLYLTCAPALAQEISIDLSNGDGTLAARSIQLIVLVTVLSLVPGLAIMITCFPFIVTVLSILRQAIGLQQSPPNMLIISLAVFLTYFVMQPVFTEAWNQGAQPLIDGKLELEPAFQQAIDPFRGFMANRLDPDTLERLASLRPETEGMSAPLEEAPLSLLIPSFLLSEIERAFQIGFLIFLPFLIIDLVVAAILMSMGMMMVPPAIVSLPFKLAFFVVADGWSLITGALVRSYF
ncbi:flagellar type III secretion system pore protein FliP [Pseudoruegeria sp. HB172150]|uniref:flagellar type III secretion system pore protein FliP n=1 Tax=Pseudoruegeria sp. HB172150 TaxID=2721164 RepID=UPI00155284CF|nr:flagellar type III secretion system pore protein FliP [Pseudoruegeria sp. HB172150]